MRLSLAVALIVALLSAGPSGAVKTEQARYLGSYTWNHSARWFGGLSAIELEGDGVTMTVLSDRTRLLTAGLSRDATGQITGVRIGQVYPVLSSRGQRMPGDAGDTEGLVSVPGGGHYISFERVHRVAFYSGPGASAQVLPRPAAFREMEHNGSFEALAMDQQGRLYTMPESSRTADGAIPVYRWDGKRWSTPFKLPQRGNFLPVGADFGPDGRLYVLERATGAFGFRSRLRRWEVRGNTARNETILFEGRTGRHDNLEGVSIWRDAGGKLRATMISDDNFLFVQRTEIVEYALPD